jgi:glycerol kinase
MALQNVDILEAMQKDLGKKMGALSVDGGAASNDLLMQLQANYLGRKIQRPKMIETTVAGAAYLAGLGVGLWKDTQEIKKVWKLDKEFNNEMTEVRRKDRLKRWHSAVGKA